MKRSKTTEKVMKIELGDVDEKPSSEYRTYFLQLTGRGKGRFYEVLGEGVIGRDGNCDVILISEGVSRRHAKITQKHGRVIIMDLDSKNGTYVDGVKILECPLYNGDIVTVGDINLRFIAAYL